MIQQKTIKNYSRRAIAGLMMIAAAMMAACSSEHEIQAGQGTGNGDSAKVFTLNALSVDVADNDGPFTRTTSRGDSWEDGDVVYVRNSSTGAFTPYVYHQETGLFLVRNDATAIQFTTVGTSSQEVEAYFRGDVTRPLTPGTPASGWQASDYTDIAIADQFTTLQDQSTDAKVQQSEFLYTEQDLVHRLDGTVGITLKHQVSRITVKVTIDTNTQEFLTEEHSTVTNTSGEHDEYASSALFISNDPDDKIYYQGTPAFAGTEMGFTLNTKLSTAIRGHRLVAANENIATGIVSGGTGTATYTALILPQTVGNQQLQDFIHIKVKGKGKTDEQAVTYKYSLPGTFTFEKGKNYTFNLQLTDGASYNNIFQDELSPSDLGKILCNDGSLIPTVAEAIDKGYTPLGHLVYYTGSKGAYYGMCMSYEDINTNNTGNPTATANSTATTLANALRKVYNYKSTSWTYTNADASTATYTKPNPGGETWCTDWFIPKTNQWALVQKMANNNDATQGISSASSAANGPKYAMEAIQNMQNKIVGSDGTTASYTYTKDALPSGVYWTSTITGNNTATTESTSAAETTTNNSSAQANTRAFFYFDGRTNPDPNKLYRDVESGQTCKFILDIDNDNDGTDLYRYVTSSDYGKVIAKQTNGWWCIMPNTTYVSNFASGTASAMIAYVGSGTSESSPYNHGLAISAADCFTGYYWSSGNWQETNTTYGNTATYFPQINSGNVSSQWMSENKGGYEKTKWVADGKSQGGSIDNYPAFKQCWNHSRVRPTGASNWFLPSARQFGIIFDYAASRISNSYRMTSYYGTIGNSWGAWTVSYSENNPGTITTSLNTTFSNAGVPTIMNINYFMTSTMYDGSNYWIFYPHTSNGYLWSTSNKQTSYYIRPFYAF